MQKKDDNTDNIAVKKIVRPILVYLFTSNSGHLFINSKAAPEEKSKKRVSRENPWLIKIDFFYKTSITSF